MGFKGREGGCEQDVGGGGILWKVEEEKEKKIKKRI